MLLIRPAKTNDLNDIYQLAQQSGIGITSLPADKKLLKAKINHSRESFAKEIKRPHDELYFFVLVDTEINKIVGTSAIDAAAGNSIPFYTYKLSKVTQISHIININNSYQLLNFVNDYQGKTELCSLFVDTDYRKLGAGLLLSRSRFLFMADHHARFTDIIFAEMRGVSDKDGCSPFWDSLGKHFFRMSFAEADRLTTLTNKQFIADLMPRNAIYVSLLSKKAQAVIGKPHRSTQRAMQILQDEGFHFNDYVDVFDAGPTIEAKLKYIKTVKNSQPYTIHGLVNELESEDYMIANRTLDYRCCVGKLEINDRQQLIINKETAHALRVKKGNTLRVIPWG